MEREFDAKSFKFIYDFESLVNLWEGLNYKAFTIHVRFIFQIVQISNVRYSMQLKNYFV